LFYSETESFDWLSEHCDYYIHTYTIYTVTKVTMTSLHASIHIHSHKGYNDITSCTNPYTQSHRLQWHHFMHQSIYTVKTVTMTSLHASIHIHSHKGYNDITSCINPYTQSQR